MDFKEINWSNIWRDGILFFAGEADKATSWNNNAKRWNDIQHRDDYGQKVLEKIPIEPNWTVLDVGCGAGLLSIPLAKKCKHITSLDISCEMLQYLKINAEKEKVTNISCINKPFEKTIIGKDIDKHDIVVASRSMGWEQNLEQFLRSMDEAAKRRAYVIWGAGDRPFDIGMYKAIGRPYGETRFYIVIYNLLYQMGIRANIEMFECQPTSMSYNSIDEAFSELCKRFERMGIKRKLNKEEENKLKNYLEQTLTRTDDGTFKSIQNRPNLQALIWWDKSTPRYAMNT
jgi:SAM-dependent methyltransferase